jgi:nicotinate phosphoribosyltransferase
VTAYDQPALGGVYKLAALRRAGGAWEHKIKLSEQTVKVSTPGILQVRRFREEAHFIGDMIYDTLLGVDAPYSIVDPTDPMRSKSLPVGATHEDLLVPVIRGGQSVYASPPLPEIRQRTLKQIASLHPTVRRLLNPHVYPAGLAPNLHELKTKLIQEARGTGPAGNASDAT